VVLPRDTKNLLRYAARQAGDGFGFVICCRMAAEVLSWAGVGMGVTWTPQLSGFLGVGVASIGSH